MMYHVTARGRSDDECAHERCVRLAEHFEVVIQRPLGRTEVKHEKLVFPIMDDLGRPCPQGCKLGWGEITEEYGILRVIALAFEKLKQLRASLVITDIVGNQEVTSGHFTIIAS